LTKLGLGKLRATTPAEAIPLSNPEVQGQT
jgi:hypothetical protein